MCVHLVGTPVTVSLNPLGLSFKSAFLPGTALCKSVQSTWPPVLVTDTSTPGPGSESSRECSPVHREGEIG